MSCIAPSRVAGLAMMPPTDPERREADAHAATCPKCRAALADAERGLASLLLVEPAPSLDEVAVARTQVFSALAEDGRRVFREAGVALAGAAVLMLAALAVFRVANPGIAALIEAGLAVAVAIFAALNARNTTRARLSVGLVLAASISMVAFELRADQPLDATHGVACGSLLSIAGLLPACFAAILSLGALEPGAAWRVAARAGAAGLIGQAALARICDHHDALHLVLFHLSGLLVVILVGSILPAVFGFVRARMR